jgi:LAO/AO transport system kinase
LIVETEALKGRGLEQLYSDIQKHREYLRANPQQLNEVLWKRARNQLVEALKDQALRTILDRLDNRGVSLDALIKMIMNKEADPYSLVHEILNDELR